MDYIKENNDVENKKNNFYLKLRKFNDFFINKSNIENDNSINIEDKEKNIYFKYLENPDIIQSKENVNNNNLQIIFQEINKDIDNGNNIILPFLENICQNLVKAYIYSNYDDSYSEEGANQYEKERQSRNTITKFSDIISLYQTVFKKLKYNCFIHKQVIINIYEYFSYVYHKLNKIKDDNKIIKKFCK